MIVEIKIYDSSYTTVQETYTETLGANLADEEMVVRGLTFSQIDKKNYDSASFTLYKTASTVTATESDIVQISV